MKKNDDFKRGKTAGKKHPNSHDADISQIEAEVNHQIDIKKDRLQNEQAKIENEIKELKNRLGLIETFLKEATVGN